MARRSTITRREFLKAGAAGTVAAGAAAAGVIASPIAFSAPQTKEPKNKMRSGIPLGGIGAGTVEIRDDGLFHEWQIFGNWRHEELNLNFRDAFLAFYTKRAEDAPQCCALATERRGNMAPVDGITYTGQFPFAMLDYQIDGSPCEIKLSAFSPFVPHDAENSGLPTAIFQFEITNRTHDRVDAAIAFSLPNTVGYDQPAAAPKSALIHGGNWQGVNLSADGLTEGSHAKGTIALIGIGKDADVATGDAKSMIAHFAGTGVVSGSGTPSTVSLSKKITLGPRESGKIVMMLTWHFPYFIDAEKLDIGRMYSNRFDSAQSVTTYVAGNLPSLETRTREFRDVFYRSNLPYWLIDGVNAQFTTLFKSSWWTKDGTFSIWEGLGCCGTQTVDVAYYGSISLIALFPELAKQAMRLSARFQNSSGRIPHFFPGTFQYPDAYHMIDLMPKFTLMVWRDYLWTGDRKYLDEMWPKVHAAMEHNRALDRNGDFVCDNHGIDQSYDGWEFEGASSYVGLINCAAFLAASHMAKLQGEDELGTEYKRLASIGAASIDKLLWNGEHFDLFYDIATDVRDKCCMADQINGLWFAQLIELGELIPNARVTSALGSMYKYNRGPDYLRNGTWREVGPEHGGQWSSVWSGAEYLVASHMMYAGMVDQGVSVAKAVYDRYAKDGRIWNHGECGEHYYRALVALGLLYAAQGFHYSAVDKRLVIEPRLAPEKHLSPIVTPLAWGEMTYITTSGETSLTIQIKGGELALSVVEIGAAQQAQARVTIAGKTLPAKLETRDGKTVVSFATIILRPGQRIKIALT